MLWVRKLYRTSYIEILSFAGRTTVPLILVTCSHFIHDLWATQTRSLVWFRRIFFFFAIPSMFNKYTWVVFHFRERENAEIYLSVGSKITGHATYVRGAFHETINRMIKLHFHGLFGLRVWQQWLASPCGLWSWSNCLLCTQRHRLWHAKWKSYFIPWWKTDAFDSFWR